MLVFFSFFVGGEGRGGRGGGLKPDLCFLQIRLNLGPRMHTN